MSLVEKQTFGIIGSGINVTILNWNGGEQVEINDEGEGELNEGKNQKSNSDPDYVGIIRVHRNTTLDTDNKKIWFEILSNSSYLMGLVTDSRDWTKKIIAD
ncbi:11927_t:CDS:2 [Diversispora eburnea]|uniref:11927_t:CDS:1 n=1 Tax=Diversispora eburnea TaxID=1213867 RepID=A0A9N8YL66_9GLOM|nr:11927_t:CDS:2 [Diversispora eburnea]